MTDEPLLYAKVGGPPDDWHRLQVQVDGIPVKCCVEANVTEGWADAYVKDADGKYVHDGHHAMLKRLTGTITILRPKAPNG